MYHGYICTCITVRDANYSTLVEWYVICVAFLCIPIITTTGHWPPDAVSFHVISYKGPHCNMCGPLESDRVCEDEVHLLVVLPVINLF